MKKLLDVHLIYISMIFAILFEAYDIFFVDNKNASFSNSVNPNVVFNSVEDRTQKYELQMIKKMSNVERYNYFLTNTHIIAHAGGSIDNHNYTNSLESLELAYKNGIRIFELDMYLTSDNYLVMTHGFSEKDYTNRMGIEYDAKTPVMTHEEFMNTKFFGQYTPVDADVIIDFMRRHEDAYLIPDIKHGDDVEYVKTAYINLINAANNDSKVLNRIVGTFLSSKTYNAVREIYNFEITAIHNRVLSSMEEGLKTDEDFIEYCQKIKVNTVMMDYKLYTKDLETLLKLTDINVVLFILDNEKTINNYLASGVDAVMSNKVLPQID